MYRQKDGFKVLLKQGSIGATLLWVGDEAEGEEVDEDGLVKLFVPAVKFSDHPGTSLVDTTGAGDTFTAAFAVALSEVKAKKASEEITVTNDEYKSCIKFANQAAFLAITRPGAMASIPNRTELETLQAEEPSETTDPVAAE